MCREGGREFRCENQYSQSCVDARNARRRALYAARKGGTVRTYKRTETEAISNLNRLMGDTQPKVQHDVPLSQDSMATLMGAKTVPTVLSVEPELTQESLTNMLGEVAPQEHTLQLQKTETNKKWLAEKGLICGDTISGTIQWQQLNEDSYVEFGFQNPEDMRVIDEYNTIHQLTLESSREMKEMSPEEKKSIRTISSGAHAWINGSLRNEGLIESDVKSLHSDAENDEGFSTREEFVQHIENLDSALEKASYDQRMLYRGLRAQAPSIQAAGGVEAYMANSFNLGQEIKFDDYLSTSYSPVISGTYASVEDPESAGIMFEIRAASGVNIVSESHFEDEKEVLLPRNSRFMVVGVHKKAPWSGHDPESDYTLKSTGNYVVQLIEITDEGSIVTSENKPAPAPKLTKKQLR